MRKIIVSCPWCDTEYGHSAPIELQEKCAGCDRPIQWVIVKDEDKNTLMQEVARSKVRIKHLRESLSKSYDMSRDSMDQELRYYRNRQDDKDKRIAQLEQQLEASDIRDL